MLRSLDLHPFVRGHRSHSRWTKTCIICQLYMFMEDWRFQEDTRVSISDRSWTKFEVLLLSYKFKVRACFADLICTIE